MNSNNLENLQSASNIQKSNTYTPENQKYINQLETSLNKYEEEEESEIQSQLKSKIQRENIQFFDIKSIKQIGNYHINSELGSGAFGKVYLGKHIPTSIPVAIKILNKFLLNQTPEDYELVNQELSILKIVKHRYIAQLYEIIETPQHIFIIMEYCEGKDLMDYILRKNKLSEIESNKFFRQLIIALIYLHKQNITHRDIKIDNMLLDKNNDLKLVDFGLSTKYNVNNIVLDQPCGTVVYAAPEVLEGKEYDGMLIDVWSSGIVLYGLLAGYLPFNDTDDYVNKKNVIAGKIEYPSFFSKNVVDLLSHMLETNEKKRYRLEDIIKHKWYISKNSENNYDIIPGIVIGHNNVPVDENVLNLCSGYDYDKEKIRKAVIENKCNEYDAIYYLIVKKMGIDGFESISDFKCNKFIEFIKNDNNNIIKEINNDFNLNDDVENLKLKNTFSSRELKHKISNDKNSNKLSSNTSLGILKKKSVEMNLPTKKKYKHTRGKSDVLSIVKDKELINLIDNNNNNKKINNKHKYNPSLVNESKNLFKKNEILNKKNNSKTIEKNEEKNKLFVNKNKNLQSERIKHSKDSKSIDIIDLSKENLEKKNKKILNKKEKTNPNLHNKVFINNNNNNKNKNTQNKSKSKNKNNNNNNNSKDSTDYSKDNKNHKDLSKEKNKEDNNNIKNKKIKENNKDDNKEDKVNKEKNDENSNKENKKNKKKIKDNKIEHNIEKKTNNKEEINNKNNNENKEKTENKKEENNIIKNNDKKEKEENKNSQTENNNNNINIENKQEEIEQKEEKIKVNTQKEEEEKEKEKENKIDELINKNSHNDFLNNIQEEKLKRSSIKTNPSPQSKINKNTNNNSNKKKKSNLQSMKKTKKVKNLFLNSSENSNYISSRNQTLDNNISKTIVNDNNSNKKFKILHTDNSNKVFYSPKKINEITNRLFTSYGKRPSLKSNNNINNNNNNLTKSPMSTTTLKNNSLNNSIQIEVNKSIPLISSNEHRNLYHLNIKLDCIPDDDYDEEINEKNNNNENTNNILSTLSELNNNTNINNNTLLTSTEFNDNTYIEDISIINKILPKKNNTNNNSHHENDFIRVNSNRKKTYEYSSKTYNSNTKNNNENKIDKISMDKKKSNQKSQKIIFNKKNFNSLNHQQNKYKKQLSLNNEKKNNIVNKPHKKAINKKNLESSVLTLRNINKSPHLIRDISDSPKQYLLNEKTRLSRIPWKEKKKGLDLDLTSDDIYNKYINKVKNKNNLKKKINNIENKKKVNNIVKITKDNIPASPSGNLKKISYNYSRNSQKSSISSLTSTLNSNFNTTTNKTHTNSITIINEVGLPIYNGPIDLFFVEFNSISLNECIKTVYDKLKKLNYRIIKIKQNKLQCNNKNFNFEIEIYQLNNNCNKKLYYYKVNIKTKSKSNKNKNEYNTIIFNIFNK